MKAALSRQNDTLSQLCWREYGRSQGMVEQVLEANPQLCRQAPVLPIGTVVYLPSQPLNNMIKPTINLWD